MAISLTGKIIISVVTVAALAGLGVGLYFIVNDNEIAEEVTTTTDSPEVTTTNAESEDVGGTTYRVGVGIADMTGPCTEIAFMGYAETSQVGQGIHLRQFARAFIFVQGDTRVVLVSAEIQSVGIAIRRQVVNNLQELYGDMYSLRNVIIAGTHTHSTPGGYLVDFLFDITIRGFSSEVYDAYVSGITRSIVRAHENMVPAKLTFAQTTVANIHMNRSPYSYEYNPAEERQRYEKDTDDTLTQVRIERADGRLHGVLNWFAIHTTSMNMTNQLISSDNLGYAALALEKRLNPSRLPGKGDVVAAFFPANLGDVSPNTRGARCEFSGNACDHHFLLCGVGERCYSQGPGEDMFDSTRIVGNAIYEGAVEALNSPGEDLNEGLAVVHQFVDMPEATAFKYDPIKMTFDMEAPVNGCVAAMGYSFASGTIDGANNLNITQGTIINNDLLDSITAIVMNPTEEDRECHAPKPILLATGRGNVPLPWHPRVASASLVWLGGLAVAGVPGEPTTMAGRRVRRVVGAAMQQRGYTPRVVVGGLTNEYIHYVATYDEYQVQRYEAASTIYGPHTLDIMLNKFEELTIAAIEGTTLEEGPEPEDNRNRTRTLITPVVFDSPGARRFGDVLLQPPPAVARGGTVSATFVAASPRNDLRQESSHAVVQRQELGQWVVYATDADWETRFTWERKSTLLATSEATFSWQIPPSTPVGQYRLVYYGVAKMLIEQRSFDGVSNTFTVTE
ncbi:hypothetical protein ACJJTC_003302 [Scirpophaga incertulas]